MSGEYIFTMQGLIKRYGRNEVLNGINLCFYHGAKIGIVGENGSGKSSLLKIMAGEDTKFEGQAVPLKGSTIGFLPQEPVLAGEKTVRENVEEAFGDIKKMIDEFNEVSSKMAEPMSDDEMEKAMEKMGRLQDQIDSVDGWELDRQVEVAMDALVLPPDDQKAGTLSGGEARRVALCKLLLKKPDMILLDEPTNHLDAETVQWLEDALANYPGNVIVSTHDRYFLDNITKWILELEGGKGKPFEGNYSSWLEQKAEILRRREKLTERDVKGIGLALNKSINREVERFSKRLEFLATTGSTTPFIGLFGTVWGIMHSFRSIGVQGTASIGGVAPGIAEALIATAAGLVAAIPAVIFFNYFNNKVFVMTSSMDDFCQDFIYLAEKNFIQSRQKESSIDLS